MFSGFAWGGFNLAVSNFIYDAVCEEKRVRCIAYFNLINGLGVFFGATLGGFIIGYLPSTLGSKILSIFLLSGLLRFGVRFAFLPHLKEVKKIHSMNNLTLFFSVIGLKPFPPLQQDSVRTE
jgi:MFS family permease